MSGGPFFDLLFVFCLFFLLSIRDCKTPAELGYRCFSAGALGVDGGSANCGHFSFKKKVYLVRDPVFSLRQLFELDSRKKEGCNFPLSKTYFVRVSVRVQKWHHIVQLHGGES